MPDDVGERLLDDPVEGELKRLGELAIGTRCAQLDGRPRSPHGVHELLKVGEARRGRERGGPGFLVAQQPEHDPQLVLGGPPDHLDRFQCGACLLRALGHQAPAHPGLDGDHRERVGDDVVQLAGDAHPLLADLLPGALGLGGSLALGLLGQPGHVTPARRHAVPDKPPGRERQEAHDSPGPERRGPFRCHGIQERRTENRRRGQHRADRQPPRDAHGHGVSRHAEHQAHQQRRGTRRHLRSRGGGGQCEKRKWPSAAERDHRDAHQDGQTGPRSVRVPQLGDHQGNRGHASERRQGRGEPESLPLGDGRQQRRPRRPRGRRIGRHLTDGSHCAWFAHHSRG